jgi:hypothetical protein
MVRAMTARKHETGNIEALILLGWKYITFRKKVKLSRYLPWRGMEGEEV